MLKPFVIKEARKEPFKMSPVGFFFTQDRVASFDCSYHNPLRQNAEIIGEKGTVEIRQWSLPNEKQCFYTVQYSTLNQYDSTEHIRTAKFTNCIQELEMIRRMTRIHQTGRIENIWPEVTLITEKILDACRRSIDRDGELVEFVKGQIPVEIMQSNKTRRLSIMGSMKAFESATDMSQVSRQVETDQTPRGDSNYDQVTAR